MKLLDRYMGSIVIKSYLLVALILLSIFSFLALVEQLEDVGDGRYNTTDALIYVGLTLPQRVLDLAPVIALLGSLVALGALAKNSELIAVRAGGVSVLQIGTSIIKPAIALMALMYITLEFVASPLQQAAEKMRASAVSLKGDPLTGTGVWSRDGRRFINIRHMLHGRVPADIDIYEFDEDGRLRTYVHANHAEKKSPRKWELVDVQYKDVRGDKIQRHRLPSVEFGQLWAKPTLPFRQLSTESLSLSGMYHYLQFLRSTNQKTDDTELLLWQRSLLPVSTLAMAMLAIPFGFGLLRSSNFPRRLALGAGTGVMFYLANQIIASVGLLTGLSPFLVAMAPIAIVLLATALLLERQR